MDAELCFGASRFVDLSPAEALAQGLELIFPDKTELLRKLIPIASRTLWAWDALSVLLDRAARDSTEPVPKQLLQWAADVANERTHKPTRGGRSFANRDIAISDAIFYIVDIYGMPATRSVNGLDLCCPEGGSACDVVGYALDNLAMQGDGWAENKNGAGPRRYKNIERIWGEWQTFAYATSRDEYQQLLAAVKRRNKDRSPSRKSVFGLGVSHRKLRQSVGKPST